MAEKKKKLGKIIYFFDEKEIIKDDFGTHIETYIDYNKFKYEVAEVEIYDTYIKFKVCGLEIEVPIDKIVIKNGLKGEIDKLKKSIKKQLNNKI